MLECEAPFYTGQALISVAGQWLCCPPPFQVSCIDLAG